MSPQKIVTHQRLQQELNVMSEPAAAASSIPFKPSGTATRVPAPAGMLFLSFGAAGVFAAATVFVTSHYMGQRAEVVRHRGAAQIAELEVKSLKQQLEAERILSRQEITQLERAADMSDLRIAKLSTVGKKSSDAVAFSVWNPVRQQGVLTVEKLAVPRAGEDYQLWVVDPTHENPVSAGVFELRSDGTARFAFRPSRSTPTATHFAISRESKGGVLKPRGPIVAAGAL